MPFESIRKALTQSLGLSTAEQTQDQDDVSLAVACLMIELCQMDDRTTPDELAQVTRALERSFELPTDLIQTVISEARSKHQKDTSFHPYVTLVNEQLNVEEKESLMRQMWRVAMADGQIDKYEEHYLRRLNDLLKLPQRTFLQTKHAVLAETDQT